MAINSFLQSELVPGKLYSMPSAVTNASTLTSKLGRSAVATSEGLELDAGDGGAGQDSSWSLAAYQAAVPEDSMMEPAFRDSVFFRVVSRRPGRARQVKLPIAAGKTLSGNDICITLHVAPPSGKECSVSMEPKKTSVGVDPLSIMMVVVEDVDIDSLENGLLIWSREKAPSLVMGRFADDKLSDLFADLCKASALPASLAALTATDHDPRAILLLELQRHGLVQLASRSVGAATCRLTVFAVQHMGCAQRIVSPQRFFTSRENLQLEDKLPYELLLALADSGWCMRRAPTSIAAKSALPAHAAEAPPRIWYASGIDRNRCRLYPVVLLKSDFLFESGSLLEVRHCKGLLLQSNSGGRVGRDRALACGGQGRF